MWEKMSWKLVTQNLSVWNGKFGGYDHLGIKIIPL